MYIFTKFFKKSFLRKLRNKKRKEYRERLIMDILEDNEFPEIFKEKTIEKINEDFKDLPIN